MDFVVLLCLFFAMLPEPSIRCLSRSVITECEISERRHL